MPPTPAMPSDDSPDRYPLPTRRPGFGLPEDEPGPASAVLPPRRRPFDGFGLSARAADEPPAGTVYPRYGAGYAPPSNDPPPAVPEATDVGEAPEVGTPTEVAPGLGSAPSDHRAQESSPWAPEPRVHVVRVEVPDDEDEDEDTEGGAAAKPAAATREDPDEDDEEAADEPPPAAAEEGFNPYESWSAVRDEARDGDEADEARAAAETEDDDEPRDGDEADEPRAAAETEDDDEPRAAAEAERDDNASEDDEDEPRTADEPRATVEAEPDDHASDEDEAAVDEPQAVADEPVAGADAPAGAEPDAEVAAPVPQQPAAPRRPGEVPAAAVALWSPAEAQRLREEWQVVAAQFVEEPEAALARAQSLVTGAIRQLAETLMNEQVDLDPRRRDAGPDTEAMRMAMRGYREFLDRVLAL